MPEIKRRAVRAGRHQFLETSEVKIVTGHPDAVPGRIGPDHARRKRPA